MLTNCRNVNLINISFVHHIEQMREVNWKIVIQSLIECSEQLGELRTSMDEERTKPDKEELTNLSWRSVTCFCRQSKQHCLSQPLVPGEGLDDLPDIILAAEEDGAPLMKMLGHQVQDGLPANSKGKSDR